MSISSITPTVDYPTDWAVFFRDATEAMVDLSGKTTEINARKALITHMALIRLRYLACRLQKLYPSHPDIGLAQRTIEMLSSKHSISPSITSLIVKAIGQKDKLLPISNEDESDPALKALTLSYPAPIEFSGVRYPSAQHAFLAQIFWSRKDLQEKIATLKTEELAGFLITHFAARRTDWEVPGLKESIMKDVLFAKFDQNPELAMILLSTYDYCLDIRGIKTDTYWTAENHGENKLGILLMQQRERLGGVGVVERTEDALVEAKSTSVPESLKKGIATQLAEIERLNSTADTSAYEAHTSVFRKRENQTLSRCPTENFPFDSTLVPLSLGKPINANFVLGRSYIAAQAPLRYAEEDFWRMTIEHGSTAIVTLNELSDGPSVAPCYAYWPSSMGEVREAGLAKIRLLAPPEIITDLSWRQSPYTETPHGFVIRKLEVELSGVKREITHYQYLHWKDRQIGNIGCVLALAERVLRTPDIESKPPVIHCAAGVGRTATFLVILDELRALKSGRPVDIEKSVRRLRSSDEGRYYKMVQSDQQYTFCYAALSQAASLL